MKSVHAVPGHAGERAKINPKRIRDRPEDFGCALQRTHQNLAVCDIYSPFNRPESIHRTPIPSVGVSSYLVLFVKSRISVTLFATKARLVTFVPSFVGHGNTPNGKTSITGFSW